MNQNKNEERFVRFDIDGSLFINKLSLCKMYDVLRVSHEQEHFNLFSMICDSFFGQIMALMKSGCGIQFNSIRWIFYQKLDNC